MNSAQWLSNIYIISGLSGAGKSTVLRVFEDLNYFVVDGLPINMITDIMDLMNKTSMEHFNGLAIGMDMRQNDFLGEYVNVLDELSLKGIKTHLIFLKANKKALMQRYATTRRPHPMEREGISLETAIQVEREALEPLRKLADNVIDSSDFSIHDLRRTIQQRYNNTRLHNLRVIVVSFGFKHNMPNDADMVFDLRFLPNPFFVDELRGLDGRDKKVADFVFSHAETVKFREKLLDLLTETLGQMDKEGRYRVTIAFGCTGGRHRSVAFAQDIGTMISQLDYPVLIEHRHVDLE